MAPVARIRTRTAIVALSAIALVVVTVLAFGGGTQHVTEPERHAADRALVIAAALGAGEAEDELERRTTTLHDEFQRRAALAERGPSFGLRPGDGDAARRSAIRRRITSIEQLRDRAADKLFEKTRVDRALDAIALRKPPLHVLQWVLTDREPGLDTRKDRERFFGMSEEEQARRLTPNVEHTVYARVDEDRFYAMSESQRAAAVKEFYRDAERHFLRLGIRDFVLVVAPYAPTTEHLPALAVGRDGAASLTPLGRTRPDPSGV